MNIALRGRPSSSTIRPATEPQGWSLIVTGPVSVPFRSAVPISLRPSCMTITRRGLEGSSGVDLEARRRLGDGARLEQLAHPFRPSSRRSARRRARRPRSATDLPGSAWRSSDIDSAFGSTTTSATIGVGSGNEPCGAPC